MNPTRKRVFKSAGISLGVVASVLWILRDRDVSRLLGVQKEPTVSLEERGQQGVGNSIASPLESPSLEYEAWTKQGWKPVEPEDPPSEGARDFTDESAMDWESRDVQGLHVFLQSVSFGIEAVPALDVLAREASHSKTRWLAIESLGRIPLQSAEDEAQAALIRLHRDNTSDPEVRRLALGQIRADSASGFSYLRDLVSQGFSQETKSEWSDAATRLMNFALSQGWSWERTQSSFSSTGNPRISQEVMGRMQDVWKNAKGRLPAFSDQKRNSK